jgi:hypothetical protein
MEISAAISKATMIEAVSRKVPTSEPTSMNKNVRKANSDSPVHVFNVLAVLHAVRNPPTTPAPTINHAIPRKPFTHIVSSYISVTFLEYKFFPANESI